MSNERRRQGPRGPMGHGMRGNGEKAKNFKGTLKKLFVYLKPYYFKLICLILVGFYLVSALFSFIQGFITSSISQKVAYDLRSSLSKKMSRMPLSYFDRHSSGDTLSRVTNDIDTIAQSLNQSLSQVITSSVTVVGIFIMMLTISVKMTLIAVLVLPLSMLLIMFVMKHSQKYFSRQQKSLVNIMMRFMIQHGNLNFYQV